MSSRRTKVRTSLLALLVAYLRNGNTNTANFTRVAGVGGSFPFTQNVWTFSLGTELYQIMLCETASDAPLMTGVMVEFGIEKASSTRSFPQEVMVDVEFVVRTPKSVVPTQESACQQIALLLDKAMFEIGGRCPIADFDVNPSVPTNPSSFIVWNAVPRGEWEFVKTDNQTEEMCCKRTVQYSQPSSEW